MPLTTNSFRNAWMAIAIAMVTLALPAFAQDPKEAQPAGAQEPAAAPATEAAAIAIRVIARTRMVFVMCRYFLLTAFFAGCILFQKTNVPRLVEVMMSTAPSPFRSTAAR